MEASEGAQAIVAKLEELGQGQFSTEYKLRDWLVSRQRYWGCPIPVKFCDLCGPITEDNLPLTLPEMDHNQVSLLKSGRPLENFDAFYHGGVCDKPGCAATREIDTLDTFIDSSWYFLRYLDPHNVN